MEELLIQHPGYAYKEVQSFKNNLAVKDRIKSFSPERILKMSSKIPFVFSPISALKNVGQVVVYDQQNPELPVVDSPMSTTINSLD